MCDFGTKSREEGEKCNGIVYISLIQPRYKILPVKTMLVTKLTTRASREKDKGMKWYMGDTVVTESDKTEHLGLIRSCKEENTLNVQKRMSLARQTLLLLDKNWSSWLQWS